MRDGAFRVYPLVVRPLFPASALLAALLACATPARAAVVEARGVWAPYAQTLALPGSAVGSALELDLRSPLVAHSFVSVMALQAFASPAALSAQPVARQVAAIRDAVRAVAAPLMQPVPHGDRPAAAMRPEVLVQLHALAGALPAAERASLIAGVQTEFERRGASLEEAARRISANFETREAEEVPATAAAGPGAFRRSGLKPFDLAARTARPARPAVDAPAGAPVLRFLGYREARDWLASAPLGPLGRVVQLPTHATEGSIAMSRGEMTAKLTRSIEHSGPTDTRLPVMITRGRATRKVLGFDVPVDAYFVLVSEVPDAALKAEPDAVGLHMTSLKSALDTIRTGVFLGAPGRMTFYRKGKDAADAERSWSEAAVVIKLGGRGFRKARFFDKEAYAPAFDAASVDPDDRRVPETVTTGDHNSYMADFAQAGLLRRIPFTADDTAATLEFLEVRRHAGLPDEIYRPMKAALENALGKVDDPFLHIEPKVSREALRRALDGTRAGTTKRVLLGRGSEAYGGVFAVAEKTADGVEFYVDKVYDAHTFVDSGVKALAVARKLKDDGLLPGFDIVDVLSVSLDTNHARLAFTEGRDLQDVWNTQKMALASAEIARRYERALAATRDALRKAGWRAEDSLNDGSLYIYPPGQGSRGKMAFQIIPQNVVATTDGRFVLIDPF